MTLIINERSRQILEQLATPVHNLATLHGSGLSGVSQEAGLYSLWWTGDTELLATLNRSVSFKGKFQPNRVRKEGETGDHISHSSVWDMTGNATTCMYVGKSTRIQNRIRLHLMAGKDPWFQKEGRPQAGLLKPTTSCQMRSGIEHLFQHLEPSKLIDKLAHFSVSWVPETSFVERFYAEELAIGCFRPWFNLDCER